MHHRLGHVVERQRLGRSDGDGLDVGGITGLQAPHEGVLADLALGEELLRRAAAHGARDRRHDDVAHVEAPEDPLVGLAVRLVCRLEADVVDVERVRVLHDELPTAQDACARPCLVAVLGLNLVEPQRKVLVGGVLPLDRQREQLLVGRPEQVVVPAAVLEPEHAVAVLGPPVRRLIRRARQQGGEQDLLSADRGHLLTDHPLDVAHHPKAQREPAEQTRPDRPDVAGPDQQLVAGNFGVGRVVAQRSQEQLGHAGDHSGPP